MSIKIDKEKIIAPMEKLVNKMNANYYTIEELNDISLLMAKLTMYSDKKERTTDK